VEEAASDLSGHIHESMEARSSAARAGSPVTRFVRDPFLLVSGTFCIYAPIFAVCSSTEIDGVRQVAPPTDENSSMIEQALMVRGPGVGPRSLGVTLWRVPFAGATREGSVHR
jgi:hypothetical protein